jgi:hypothetical protein
MEEMYTIFLYGKPNWKEGLIKIWNKLKVELREETEEVVSVRYKPTLSCFSYFCNYFFPCKFSIDSFIRGSQFLAFLKFLFLLYSIFYIT